MSGESLTTRRKHASRDLRNFVARSPTRNSVDQGATPRLVDPSLVFMSSGNTALVKKDMKDFTPFRLCAFCTTGTRSSRFSEYKTKRLYVRQLSTTLGADDTSDGANAPSGSSCVPSDGLSLTEPLQTSGQ